MAIVMPNKTQSRRNPAIGTTGGAQTSVPAIGTTGGPQYPAIGTTGKAQTSVPAIGTTGGVVRRNRAVVFSPGDAYAPEGSLGKTQGNNPAPPRYTPPPPTYAQPYAPKPFQPVTQTINKPLVALTGNANVSDLRIPTATTTGRTFDNGPIQRTLPTQPSDQPLSRLTSGSATNPIPRPYYLGASPDVMEQQQGGIVSQSPVAVNQAGTFGRRNTTRLEDGLSYLTPQGLVTTSPDTAQQQAIAGALDDYRREQALFSINTFGKLPENIPASWAGQWGLTADQLRQMGYKLVGNVWFSDTTGFKSPYGGGGGSSGGGGGSTTRRRSGGGGVAGGGYGTSSGYSSDQIFNWRLATG